MASSVSDANNHDITDINRIQEYTFNVGITLEAATSGRHHWGRGGGGVELKRNADWRREG